MAAKQKIFENEDSTAEQGLIESSRAIRISHEEREIIETIKEELRNNINAGRPFDYNIDRLKFDKVAKIVTPFSQVIKYFIDDQKGRGNSPVTIKHYEQTIRKLQKFFCWYADTNNQYEKLSDEERIKIGGQQAFGIIEGNSFEADFREFLLEEEKVSEVTVATYFRDYRAIAYWLMENELIDKRHIVVKNVEADIKEVYSSDDLDKLLKKPSDDCSFKEYRDWVVINYVLATGNRVGTIVNIKIADVDFEERMISINTQKNKRKARIPIEDNKLLRILREYIEDWLIDENGNYKSPYLFPSSYIDAANYPMTRERLANSIAEYNKSRGVSKTSIHLFRHTFVKNWIMTGGDLHMLQRVLGHRTLAMVTHYANLYDVDLRQGINEHSLLATHKTKNKGKMIQRKKKD